jgi:pyruvate kinase
VIVAFTESGSTARLVSSFRPLAPIAAITYNDDTYRRLALWWGVVPLKSNFETNTDEMIQKGEELLVRNGLAAAGDTVLMLGGQQHTKGATNMMRVLTLA